MNYRLWARSGNCRGDKRTANGGRIFRRFDGCRLRPPAANSLSENSAGIPVNELPAMSPFGQLSRRQKNSERRRYRPSLGRLPSAAYSRQFIERNWPNLVDIRNLLFLTNQL
jgi:hypothetical protein